MVDTYTWIAAALAACAALIELLARYRDEPFKAVFATFFSLLYLAINAGMGVLAHAAVLFSIKSYADMVVFERIELAIAAGFGAAAILRARIINARVGSTDVPIGPAYVLDQLLIILDRQIDRKRAVQRTRLVKKKMQGLDYDKAGPYAKVMIRSSMQNLSIQSDKALDRGFDIIDKIADEQDKAYALGFLILDYAGEKLFEVFLSEPNGTRLKRDGRKTEDQSRTMAAATRRSELVRRLFQGVTLQQIRKRLQRLAQQGPPPATPAALPQLIGRVDELTQQGDTIKDPVSLVGFELLTELGEEYLTGNFTDLTEGADASPPPREPGAPPPARSG